MAATISTLNDANRNLQADKAVAERRADMANRCECLAAWDNTRECICDKTVEMPLAVDRLRAATAIVSEIERIDANMKLVQGIDDDPLFCKTAGGQGRHRMRGGGGGGMVIYCDDDDDDEWAVTFKLPKGMIIAALHEERIRLMTKLAETGIISVNRPNIKAVPK